MLEDDTKPPEGLTERERTRWWCCRFAAVAEHLRKEGPPPGIDPFLHQLTIDAALAKAQDLREELDAPWFETIDGIIRGIILISADRDDLIAETQIRPDLDLHQPQIAAFTERLVDLYQQLHIARERLTREEP